MSDQASTSPELTDADGRRESTQRLVDLLGFALFGALLLAALIRSGFLTGPLYGDESHFFPSTVKLAPFGLAKLSTLSEISSPTFFIAFSYVVRLLGPDVFWCRLVVLGSLVACVLTARSAAREMAARAGAAPALGAAAWALMLTFPYLVGCGAYYYSDVPALLFGVLACRAVMRGRTGRAVLWATLALHCRQFYVFLPVAMIGCEGWRWLRSRDSRALAGTLIWALPIASFLPYVVLWGGPSPMHVFDPRMRDLPLVQPWHVTFLLAVSGIYLLPVAVATGWRRWGGGKLACVAGGLLLFALLPPRQNIYYVLMGSNIETMGVLHAALHRLLGTGGALAVLSLGMVSSASLHYELLFSCRRREAAPFKWMLVAFWGMNLFSHLTWEKYLLPALPVIYLTALGHPLLAGARARAPVPSEQQTLEPV